MRNSLLLRAASIGAVCIVVTATPAPANTQDECTQSDDWWLRIKACTAAIESPRWTGALAAWAYSNRAVAHAALGNALEAFDDHRKAVSLNPNDPVARNNKGNSHADFREYKRALAEYDSAIRLRPGYVNAYYNRANAHFALEDFAAAVDDFSVVLEDRPDDGDALTGRAEARCLAGDIEGSVGDRLDALRLGTLALDDTAAYLQETGYLRQDAEAETIDAIAPGLAAWTEAGCP
ncbi:MAG: tetratricopeptide repeat protein [Pseudomonadota bacterium]